LRDDDFTIVQISNTVKYPHDKTFLTQTKNLFKQKAKFQYKFLRDIPREDVEAAFDSADIVMSASLKEVAPITILEAMAAKTLWISMDVGNVEELFGGVVIGNGNQDEKGYKVFKDSVYDDYAHTSHEYLDDKYLLSASGLDGREMIEKFYNWDKICEQYYNIFIDERG
jgi:glycosyltransferase involved in cell wall biosynthesis